MIDYTKDRDKQQMQIQRLKEMKSSDLPTSITCKSGGFEKKLRKTGRLGPQTWRLQKYASNKNNNDRLFVSEYSLLYRELLYHDRELASQTVSLTVKP